MMKCQIENIKDTIAREYGFSSWDQYFEYFITTKPGRKVLRSGIRKVLWEVLLLSNDLLSCPKCILKNYESKELEIKAGPDHKPMIEPASTLKAGISLPAPKPGFGRW